MNVLQTQYLNFKSDKAELESKIAVHAQRMINFLRKWHPHGYVDFDLWGERKKTDTLDRFTLKYDSDEFLTYETPLSDYDGFEYFFVPFDYIDSPDTWEKEIKAKVKADREKVLPSVKSLLSESIKKSEYYLYSYPHPDNESGRFLRVVLDEGKKDTENERLNGIINSYHPGFVFDKGKGTLWLDGPVRNGDYLPVFDWDSIS